MKSESYRIYKNLKNFMSHRRLESMEHVQTGDREWLPEKDFLNILYKFEYVLIKGTHEDIDTYMYLFKKNSNIEINSDKLKRLITKTPNYEKKEIKILLITRNKLDTYRTKAVMSKNTDITHIQNIYYMHLISNPFDHYYCEEHIILNQEEIDELLDWFDIEPDNLPKIHVTEKTMIWLDPKIGDIIRINTVGESGDVVNYRLVVE